MLEGWDGIVGEVVSSFGEVVWADWPEVRIVVQRCGICADLYMTQRFLYRNDELLSPRPSTWSVWDVVRVYRYHSL